MNSKQHVFVAMSGGVDSSIAAAILQEVGYRITGIHMRTWKDPKWEMMEEDPSKAESLAEESADALGINFISLDLRDEFYQIVIKHFINQYLNGLTPNPCLFCNPQVKWGILQTYALEHGADLFATGHYARIAYTSSGNVQLIRGKDLTKDQSYVLSLLSQFQLSHSLLPLGELTKNEVRRKAKEILLPVADRQDSQDLCFLGNVDYRDFLKRYAPESFEKGEIVDIHGHVLGEHDGLAFYTIGQRKGISIAAAEPYYVVNKDQKNNLLVVGYADHSYIMNLTAIQPNWISGSSPDIGQEYDVMIRYRAKPEKAILLKTTDSEIRLKFENKLRGVTPGQVAVLYRDDICLGGAVIQSFE